MVALKACLIVILTLAGCVALSTICTVLLPVPISFIASFISGYAFGSLVIGPLIKGLFPELARRY